MIELDKIDIRTYVLAGNAIVTLQSDKTQKYYTYKVKRNKNNANLYAIYSLRGSDNTNDYYYVGCYYSDNNYFHVARQYQTTGHFAWPKTVRAVHYLFEHLDTLPDWLHVYHNGYCGRCGHLLTTPESIKRGLGPYCARR